MRNAVFLLAVGAVAGACSCTHAPKDDDVMARVEARSITRRDLQLRTEEQKLENPGATIQETAVYTQLLRAFTYAEIMNRYGHPVTRQVLETEAERINKQTLMPDRLKILMAVFPSHQSYLDLYVLPVYVNRVLYYDMFATDRRFHQDQFDKISGFRAEALKAISPQDPAERFKSFVQQHQMAYNDGVASPSGVRPAELPASGAPEQKSEVPENVRKAAFGKDGAKSETAQLIDEVLSKMAPGQLTPVIDSQSQFSVMRLIKKRNPAAYEVQIAALDKAPFETWAASQARKLTIRCETHDFCSEALARLRQENN